MLDTKNMSNEEKAQYVAKLKRLKELKDQKSAMVQQPSQPAQPQTNQVQPVQERGILGRVADVFTGSDRQTEMTKQLKSIGSSPELNEFSLDAAKTGLVQTFGSEASFLKRLKDMGASIGQDEKGNLIASLPSGEYLVNPPGLDPADVAKGLSQAGAFMVGSALAPARIIPQALAGGATSAAVQGASQAVGGESIDPKTVAIDAAFGAGGQAASNLVSTAGRLFRGVDETTDAAALANFAKSNELPLMTSDIYPPTTFAGKAAQAIPEKVPVVGTGGMRESQQVARQNFVSDMAQRYGSPSDEVVMQSLSDNVSKVKQAAGKRMSNVQAAMGSDPIPLTNTVKAIDDFIAETTRGGKAFDDAAVNRVKEFKDRILSGNNDFNLLRENRTYFREFIKGDSPVMTSQANVAIDKLYNAMTKDITEAVSAKLGPKEAARLREADAVYFNEVQGIKNTRLKNILAKGDQAPELVNNMLFSKRPSEVASLYRSLDQVGRQHARAAVLHKAFQSFADTKSVEQFNTALKKMGPQIDIMFRGRDRDQLKGMIKYLNATRRASEASVQTPTGQQLIGFGAIYDVTTAGGAATAGAVTLSGLARVYESRPVSQLMLRLNSARAGSPEFERLTAELSRALTSQAQAQTE